MKIKIINGKNGSKKIITFFLLIKKPVACGDLILPNWFFGILELVKCERRPNNSTLKKMTYNWWIALWIWHPRRRNDFLLWATRSGRGDDLFGGTARDLLRGTTRVWWGHDLLLGAARSGLLERAPWPVVGAGAPVILVLHVHHSHSVRYLDKLNLRIYNRRKPFNHSIFWWLFLILVQYFFNQNKRS